jgi:integrase
MTKLPLQYIHAFRDRHGRMRYYFRRPGFRRIPLKGEPWSPEFMDAYRAARDGITVPKTTAGEIKSQPGTIAAAIAGYLGSADFQGHAPETRRTRRNILDRFRRDHGEKRVAGLRRVDIDRMMAARVSTPSSARNFLHTLRAMLDWCITAGLRSDNPTTGVKSIPIKTAGYRTWTEEDIAQFEAKHPIGTRPRLALDLLLYTAQRRSDVVTMGKQHVREGAIQVRQQKTGAALLIPIHPRLKASIDACPSGNLAFLVTAYGNPFTAAGFTNWFREQCNAAGLPKGTSAHGLRKAACRRLAEAGCSANVIASISGHTSLREVQRYTAAAEQRRLAEQGIAMMVPAVPPAEHPLANPEGRFAKSRSKSLKRKA